MKIVITGPTGAIGMALIKRCLELNTEVLAVCHKGSKRIEQIPKDDRVKIIEADLQDYANLKIDTYEDYDIFIHLAWNGTFGDTRNDMRLQSDNIKFALDAVELANRLGCKTFIGAGSQAEYGRVDKPLTSDTPAFP